MAKYNLVFAEWEMLSWQSKLHSFLIPSKIHTCQHYFSWIFQSLKNSLWNQENMVFKHFKHFKHLIPSIWSLVIIGIYYDENLPVFNLIPNQPFYFTMNLNYHPTMGILILIELPIKKLALKFINSIKKKKYLECLLKSI